MEDNVQHFMSDNIDELTIALSHLQSEIEPAAKSSNNPFFKSKYADLSEVLRISREPMKKFGLAVCQMPIVDGSRVGVRTVLSHISGQWFCSELTFTLPKDDAQGGGSAITYARRYALASMLGISQEDDDGNKASEKKKEKKADPNKKVEAFDLAKFMLDAKPRGWTSEDLKEDAKDLGYDTPEDMTLSELEAIKPKYKKEKQIA